MSDEKFAFYPDRFLGGTMGWTYEQKGIYLEILIFQWKNGPFSLQKIAHFLGKNFKKNWPFLVEKFTEIDGLFFNEFMEEQRAEKLGISEVKKKAAAARWKKGDAHAYAHGYAHGYANDHAEPEKVTNSALYTIESNNIVDKEKGGLGEKGKDTPTTPATKKSGRAKAVKTLFRNSPFADLQTFQMQFLGTEWTDQEITGIHFDLLNWSNSNHGMKADWIATANVWLKNNRTKNSLNHGNQTTGRSAAQNTGQPKPGSSAARTQAIADWSFGGTIPGHQPAEVIAIDSRTHERAVPPDFSVGGAAGK